MPLVKCTIKNCHYWTEGQGCDASEILITTDRVGATEPERIDAPVANTIENENVEKCMETCCKTFIKETSRKKTKDDVALRPS